MSRPLAAALLVYIAAAMSCLAIDPPDGALKCNLSGGKACPDGYFCKDQDACYRMVGGGGSGGGGTPGTHQGQSCAGGGGCDNGLFCVDSICCESDCSGQCQACDVAGALGKCTPVSGDPHGGRNACAGGGSSCAGACDGSNGMACTYPTVSCGTASCSGGMLTPAASCSAGSCAATKVPCPLNSCDSATTCLGVTQVSMGLFSTCALLTDQTVRCWGQNDWGQLGLGAGIKDEKHVPTPVVGLGKATSIAVGFKYACAILTDKTAQCWGINDVGQLGRSFSDNLDHGVPDVVKSMGTTPLADVRQLALGYHHACARLGDGSVQCWGSDQTGTCGNGNAATTPQLSAYPVCGTGNRMAATCAPMPASASIAAGSGVSCALSTADRLACWGENEWGELATQPMPDTNRHATPEVFGAPSGAAYKQVGAGADAQHLCALLSDATVMCWGQNNFGQLGRGTFSGSYTSQARVCADATCATNFTGATRLAGGGAHECAVMQTGAVRCWGSNSAGQLGDGTMAGKAWAAAAAIPTGATAVTCGFESSCAILTDGSLRCWGSDSNGQLGDADTAAKPTPVAPHW